MQDSKIILITLKRGTSTKSDLEMQGQIIGSVCITPS